MKSTFLQGALALGALALIPATTAALADGEASSYKALDEFMDCSRRSAAIMSRKSTMKS